MNGNFVRTAAFEDDPNRAFAAKVCSEPKLTKCCRMNECLQSTLVPVFRLQVRIRRILGSRSTASESYQQETAQDLCAIQMSRLPAASQVRRGISSLRRRLRTRNARRRHRGFGPLARGIRYIQNWSAPSKARDVLSHLGTLMFQAS